MQRFSGMPQKGGSSYADSAWPMGLVGTGGAGEVDQDLALLTALGWSARPRVVRSRAGRSGRRALSDTSSAVLVGAVVVVEVVEGVFAPWSGGAGADGVAVGFLVEVEEVVAEVFFEDADRPFLAQSVRDCLLAGGLVGGLLLQ